MSRFSLDMGVGFFLIVVAFLSTRLGFIPPHPPHFLPNCLEFDRSLFHLDIHIYIVLIECYKTWVSPIGLAELALTQRSCIRTLSETHFELVLGLWMLLGSVNVKMS